MSALVDALCAPPSSGDPAALIYDTFNAASFFFDNAAAFYDSGIVTVPAPAPVHPNDAAGTAAAADSTTTSLAPRRKRRRRAVRSCKSKEEAESQRMTHIAVERNRRRQMNEYLAVLRSLMPEAYVQRGDQASIVGGAIEFVKELEQQLQSLEAQKRTLVRDLHKEAKPEAVTPPTHAANAAAVVVATATPTCAAAAESATTTSNCSSSVTEDAPDALPPPFARFFTYPQYVWCHGPPRDCATTTAAAEDGGGEGRPGVADVEVTLVETHASVRVMAPRRPGQLLRMVSGLQALRLTTLHLTVTALDALALYTLSVKVEEGCCLTTVEDIAGAVHQVLCMIDADAATRHLLGVGAEGH